MLCFNICLPFWVAKSGEYGGWVMNTLLFLAKHSRTIIGVWAGALASYKIRDLFFYNYVRFWRIASRNCRITSRLYSLLTVRASGKNLWCITPLQSKRTVSKTFTFDRTWRSFFRSLLFWMLQLRWLGFDFNVTAVRTPMIRQQLCPFWANLDRQHLLIDIHASI